MLLNAIEGFIKLSLDKIGMTNYAITPEAIQRQSDCNACIFGGKSKIETWDKFCKRCGCFTPAKVVVEKESCPENKW